MKDQSGRMSVLTAITLTILIVLTGCSTYEECDVSYLTPSTKAIPGATPKVHLMLRTTYGLGERSSTVFAELKRAIAIQKGLKITEMGSAEYIICLDLFYVYRQDDPKAIPFNTRISKTPIDSNKSSGTQTIQKTSVKTAIGTLIANVSLYRTHTLEPVTYFSLVNYTTLSSPLNGKLPSKDLVSAKLAKEIVAKIKELMVTDYRTIKTFLPNNGDAALLSKFKSNSSKKGSVFQVASTKSLTSKMREEMRTYHKMYKENPKAKEKSLSNYYIKFLMNERSDITVDNLKGLHNGYMYILGLTDNEGLIIGCANSLGRIENKCDCLGIAIPE